MRLLRAIGDYIQLVLWVLAIVVALVVLLFLAVLAWIERRIAKAD